MNIYKKAFSLGLQRTLNYRANFYIGMLSIVLPLAIRYFLWTSIYSAGGEVQFGYTLPQMLSYTLFAVITARLVDVGFVYGVNLDIKTGAMASYLVRPMRYMPYQAVCFMGDKSIVILLSSIMVIGFSVFVNSIWESTIEVINVVLYFLVLFLGILLNFAVYFCIAGIAFWIREASGTIMITMLMGSIMSGSVFPLDIFSNQIQFLLKLMPFSYTNYFPVSVLCGRTVGDEIIYGVLLQLIWIAVMLLLQQLVWKRGIRKYTAVGG